MTTQFQNADALATKILYHSRKLITKKAPFLLEAVYAPRNQATDSGAAIFTDGATLYYDPQQVIADFRKDHNSIARQLLHVTAHCLLGHPPQRGEFSDDTKHFDAAADMKAAQFVSLACGDEFAHRLQSIDYIRHYDRLSHLPTLCKALRTAKHTQSSHYQKLVEGAHFDEHEHWNPPEKKQWASSKASADGNAPNWEQLMMDLASEQHGSLPGSLSRFLQEQFSVKEPGLSYSSFLRRFAAPQERLLTDPDTFDPRWYHIGLSYYGNIPLLEEAEISEPPVLDDLVIALDTSGSCSGEVCLEFLRETLGILRDISAGAPRFRITLMQCDTEVQSVVILETQQQVEELFQSFTATGFGGTDFRPVFDHIDAMRANGTLPRVRGLLYLSDGYGDFPEQPSEYPTAFLIPEWVRNDNIPVPDWITKLYFNQENFTVEEV